MAIIKSTSLDSTLALLKDKLAERDRLKDVQEDLESTITALRQQLGNALVGTGLLLVATDSFEGTVMTPKVTRWQDLRVGDTIKVCCYNFNHGDEYPWDIRTIAKLEDPDYTGDIAICCDRELSDGSHWVDTSVDKWVFVSR